jgi:hypothetical protein
MITKYILPTALSLLQFYYKSGSSYTSVFTVVIPGVIVELNDATPPIYYGRVRSFDSSGNRGPWTSLIGSVATLIDSAEITELTATKIKAGTITSSIIALDGANSIIKSANYDAGSGGWAIKGDGTAEFGSASIRGGLKAESVFINADNRWRRNAGDTAANSEFKVGSADKYLYYDGNATLTFTGNLSAAGGTFSGALSAATGTFSGALSAATGTFSGNLSAAGGTFSGDLSAAGGTFDGNLSAAGGTFSGDLSAAGGTFSGDLSAASGTFTGTITIGDVEVGNDVGPGAGHYGISLASGDFNNIFLRRNDGVYFFRCGLGTANSIDFNSINGLNIVGSMTGASTVLIGNATSAGYLYINSGARMIVNGVRFQNRSYSGWDGSFYPYLHNTYHLGVAGNSNLDPYYWLNIYYSGSLIGGSDRRIKNSIEDAGLGLKFIEKLRPVSYKMNSKQQIPILDEDENPIRDENGSIQYNFIPGVRRHYGLIAQEVKETIDELGLSALDFSGWGLEDPEDENSSQVLMYIEFISPLIKAVQELSAKVADLESKMI